MSDQQQPYAPQPDQPASPYGQLGGQYAGQPMANGFSAPGYGAAPARPSRLGRTAFILALITAAFGLIFVLANPFLTSGVISVYAFFQILTIVRTAIGLIVGAVTLILGIIAARQGAQPVLAGIAIGVGALEILGRLISFFVTLIYTVL